MKDEDFYQKIDDALEELIREIEEDDGELMFLPESELTEVVLCTCGQHLIAAFEDPVSAHRKWEESEFS